MGGNARAALDLRAYSQLADSIFVDTNAGNTSYVDGDTNSELIRVIQSPRIEPPPASVPIDITDLIAMPVLGVTSTVVSYTIPDGWLAIFFGCSCNFAGGGFQQGSGDLVWRLWIDNAVVRNYDNVRFEKGTVQQFRQIPGGLLVVSNSVIKWTVTHAANNLLNGPIICSLAGYMFPQHREDS